MTPPSTGSPGISPSSSPGRPPACGLGPALLESPSGQRRAALPAITPEAGWSSPECSRANISRVFKILSTCRGGGYRYCRTEPPHPRANSMGLYPLHRVLVENDLGRLLTPSETVHHRDGDKENNTLGNLGVMSRSEHARLHARQRAQEPVQYTCPVCGTEFLLKAHVARQRESRANGSALACSRRCAYWRFHGPKN